MIQNNRAETRRAAKALVRAALKPRIGWAMLCSGLCKLPGMLVGLALPLLGTQALLQQFMTGYDSMSVLTADKMASQILSKSGTEIMLVLLIDLLMTGPLYLGFSRYCIKMVREENPKLEEIIYCFSSLKQYARGFSVNVSIMLRELIWSMSIAFGVMAVVMCLSMPIAAVLLSIPIAIYAVYAFASIQSYSGAYVLLYDDEKLRTGIAVRVATQSLRPRIGELMMFCISFAGWSFALGAAQMVLQRLGLPIAATIAGFVISLFLILYKESSFFACFCQLGRDVAENKTVVE